MNILDVIVGKPIPTSDERAEQIGPSRGIPIFGLDALSSAAYGPEAALVLLIPLGLAGVRYIVPVSAAIITLLVIVYFSYRQTIAAYPGGGGSYTVARFNLGANLGRVAGAGVADHIHWHVVPRWEGDTNFMPVITQTRVASEHLAASFALLEPLFRQLQIPVS
jgi:hypothetical protein